MFTVGFWLFNAVVAVLLAIDLFMHRKAHTVTMKESLLATAFWISLAGLFNLGVYYYSGSEAALLFLTAYLIEESLSIDNLFVFLLIFKTLQIPTKHQHKVLFWGIFGAIIFRAAFILIGIYLIQSYGWLLYIFGAFLVYAGIKFALNKDTEIHPEQNPVVLFFEKFFPVSKVVDTSHFFLKGAMTPLFIALVMVETSDILFALDSIPAVFAITRDPFIAYTSNIFAILGLRALYFSIRGLLDKFHHLHYGLAFILVFIGVKMLIEPWIHLPISVTLGVIVFTLILCILSSLVIPPFKLKNPYPKKTKPQPSKLEGQKPKE